MREKREGSLNTIWLFLKPYKFYLVILLGLCLVTGLLETLHMALLYPILNASLEKGAGPGDNFFFRILNDITEMLPVNDALIANCILFAVLTGVYTAGRLIYHNLSPRVAAKIVREHEQQVFQKYTESDYRFFTDVRQGDLIYKGSQAPQFIGNVVKALVNSSVETLLAMFVLVLLLTISWKATIAVVFAGGAYYYFTQYLSKRIAYVAGRGMREAIQNENVLMNEYITGVKQIRASGSSAEWRRKFDRAAALRWKHWARNLFWNQVPPRILELLLFGSIAIVVIIVKIQYPDDFFSMIPMFGTFAFALLKLLPKLSSTGSMLMDVSNWLPNLEAVKELLQDDRYTGIKNGTVRLEI
ncbi:MAG: ABC transporter transmembrane domain-containing protein [Dehalococcoidia bacterium]